MHNKQPQIQNPLHREDNSEYDATVAVVILNWNGQKFLEQFLPTLIEYTPPSVAKIVIADNASTDNSISFLQNNYPNLEIIQNSKNFGFAQGYNEALKYVNAKFYVLLNSDIEVSPNWIEPIIAMMEADPLIAAAQPKLRSYFQRDHFEYAGGAGGFLDRWGYPFCRGRIFNTLEKDEGQYDQACEIFWATGAALFVRADLYQKYGGLDADFFAHMEEIDFCWRLKNMGYKIMYCPNSVVYHIGGGTLPKSSAHKTYLNFRNNLSLLYKNLTRMRFHRVMVARVFLDFIAACSFILSTGFAEYKAVYKAYAYLIKMRNMNRKKRELLVQHSFVPQMYKGSIVFDYYLRRISKFSKLPPEKFYLEDKASTPNL